MAPVPSSFGTGVVAPAPPEVTVHEPELFGRLVVEIHAHVHYQHHQGWTVWISRRHEGTPFTEGQSEQYGPLGLDELLSVLDPLLSSAYLGTRYQD